MKKTKYKSNCMQWLLSFTVCVFFSSVGGTDAKQNDTKAETKEATADEAKDAEEESVNENAEAEDDDGFDVSDPSDADNAALYSAIFGTVAEEKDILLDYDVLIDGEKVGTAPVFAGKNSRIQAAVLKELLVPFLDSDDISPINAKADKEGFVSFNDLTQMSLKTKINRLTMCVEVSLPIEKKKIRNLSTFSKRREIPNAFPANISGFCNIRASETFYNEATSYNTKNLVLDPALNFWGLCIEGQTTYTKSSNSKEKGRFKRDYTTAVYDFPNHDITLKYGDVFSRSLSYQSVPHVWGFNFNKGVELAKQEGYGKHIQLTLLRKSTIEIYSDGHLIRTKSNVAPGTYIFDDISFHNGDNNIKVKIIDETGHEEILDESCFYESSYVPRGEFTVNATYGYPQVHRKSEGRYDKKHPIWSGTMRYGLLPSVEIGFGMLKNSIGCTKSYEIKNKNLLGNFDFKFASSVYEKNSVNLKGNVFYISYNTPSITFGKITTGLSTSYERSDNFFKPYLSDTGINSISSGDLLRKEENEKGKNTSFTYGMWINNVFSLNFNFSGSIRKRYDNAKSHNYSFSCSKSFSWQGDWFDSGSVSATFEREHSYDKVSRKSFSLYCSIYLKNRVAVSTGMSKNDSVRSRYVTMSYYPEDTGSGGEVTASRAGALRTMRAHVNYSNHVFKGNASHSKNNNGTSSTNIGLETGVFFADTSYGVARPNYSDGGFVVVTPRKALADSTLKITSQNAESGFLGGGAVIPNSKKTISTAHLDLKDLPMGLDVKKDTIISYGEYKRGFVADIEAEGSFTADGYLFDSDGEAFQHTTGYAMHTTDLSVRPIAFFTNDEGRFILTELKQGKYKISLNVEGIRDFEIEIKETNNEIIHLGKFTCKESD